MCGIILESLIIDAAFHCVLVGSTTQTGLNSELVMSDFGLAVLGSSVFYNDSLPPMICLHNEVCVGPSRHPAAATCAVTVLNLV